LEAPKYNCEAPITEVWGGALSGIQRQSPWSGSGAQSLSEAETFFGFWTFNGSFKFALFSKILKCKKLDTICVVFAKK